MLDETKIVAQLIGLERRTARRGRDSIDHGPGAHDDLANAVAGSLVSHVPAVQVPMGVPVIIEGGGYRNPFGDVGPSPVLDDSSWPAEHVLNDARIFGLSIREG